jgi:hypothetical protein
VIFIDRRPAKKSSIDLSIRPNATRRDAERAKKGERTMTDNMPLAVHPTSPFAVAPPE